MSPPSHPDCRATLQGAGAYCTALHAGGNDTTIATFNGGYNSHKDILFAGHGATQLYTSAFGVDGFPSNPTVLVANTSEQCRFERCFFIGGYNCINVQGQDTAFDHCWLQQCLGSALMAITASGQVWCRRTMFDSTWPSGSPSNTVSGGVAVGSWAASTPVVTGPPGTIWAWSGYILQCVQAGTTGSSQPALLSLGQTITDGTAKWKVVCENGAAAVKIDTTSTSEDYFEHCDFSAALATGINIDSMGGTGIVDISKCVFSGQVEEAIVINAGTKVSVSYCELFGGWGQGGAVISLDSGFTGQGTADKNWMVGGVNSVAVNYTSGLAGVAIDGNQIGSSTSTAIAVGANIGNLQVRGNRFGSVGNGQAVDVAAGSGDYIIVMGNLLGGNAVTLTAATGSHITQAQNE